LIGRRIPTSSNTIKIMPTFNRASKAYNANLNTLVDNDIPRFGYNGSGLLIEEATANLYNNTTFLPTYNKSAGYTTITAESISDTYGSSSIEKITVTAGTSQAGYESYRAYATVIANAVYTLSFKVKVISGSIDNVHAHSLGVDYNYSAVIKTALNDGWYLVTFCFTQNSSTINNSGVGFNGAVNGVYYVTEIQLEQKSYPTSYIDSTRFNETLKISDYIFNYIDKQITIELNAIVLNRTSKRYLFDGRLSSFSCLLDFNIIDNNSVLQIEYYNTAAKTYLNTKTSYILSDSNIHKYMLTYDYETNTINVYVDNVNVLTKTITIESCSVPTAFYIANSQLETEPLHGYVSNFKISNIIRTPDNNIDKDYNTIYYLPLEDSLNPKI